MEIKKGDRFECVKAVSLGDFDIFKKGKIYVSDEDGTLTNEQNNKPKIANAPVYMQKCFVRVKDVVTEGIPLEKSDPVNHPPHYTQGKIESIDAIESALGVTGFEGFLAGNAMKYIHRYRHKNGIEDVKKARWYLDRLIKTLEDAGT